jgi:apolipoprotein N-acyltransferase
MRRRTARRWRDQVTYVGHLIAGAVASLSLPPHFLLPAIGVLSIPMLAYCRAQSRRQAAMIWLATGVGWFFASTYWVSHALVVNAPSLWLLRPPLAFGLALCLGAFWAAAAFLAWSCGRRPLPRALWLVTALGLAEWGRGFVATGFPWNLPASLFSVTLESLQAASVFGAYGLTMIVLLAAMAPAFWLLRARRLVIFCLAVPAILYGGGVVRLAEPRLAAAEGPRLRLVQPVVPQAEKWNLDRRPQHLADLKRLSRQAGPSPDLIIWPETAFAGFPGREAETIAGLVRESTAGGAQLLTGAPQLAGPRGLLNSALLFRPDGHLVGTYDKRHLVPFGEYIPLRRLFPFIAAFVGPVDFTPGLDNRLLPFAGDRRMQVLICYEVIFAGAVIDQNDRPDLMVNLTNDAWFGDSAGPWQHLYQAQMRAVEEGLPLVRVANTGISAGFDAMGRPLGMVPLNRQGVLDLAVPPALPPTLYARYGNLGFFLLLALTMLRAVQLDLARPIRQ